MHQPGKKRALLIAVRHVPGLPILHYAHRDVREIANLLTNVYGYPPESTVVMMHDTSVARELWPSRSNIIKQIKLLVRDVSPGDHLFFYYSGHGHQVTCTHHSETDGMDEEIYCYTGHKIGDNVLKKYLVKPLPRGCKLFALWDSCHSKTILDLDHHNCNEPECEGVSRRRKSHVGEKFSKSLNHLPESLRAFCGIEGAARNTRPQDRHVLRPGRKFDRRSLFRKRVFDVCDPDVLRGRALLRPSMTLTSDFVAPSMWLPFPDATASLRRVLSPQSWFECDGHCKMPKEEEQKWAHVISLSACQDNELAYDDNAAKGTVTTFFVQHLQRNPKSTLLELLLDIRRRVDLISEKRQVDMQTKVISRRATGIVGHKNTPPKEPMRRNTEVCVRSLEEFLRHSSQENPTSDDFTLNYCQRPGYSSHYRLDLNEMIDL